MIPLEVPTRNPAPSRPGLEVAAKKDPVGIDSPGSVISAFYGAAPIRRPVEV
jgi:hypothetical protein